MAITNPKQAMRPAQATQREVAGEVEWLFELQDRIVTLKAALTEQKNLICQANLAKASATPSSAAPTRRKRAS